MKKKKVTGRGREGVSKIKKTMWKEGEMRKEGGGVVYELRIRSNLPLSPLRHSYSTDVYKWGGGHQGEKYFDLSISGGGIAPS